MERCRLSKSIRTELRREMLWKARLRDHGIKLDGATNLTEIRFADDLMLYAKSWQELVVMLESLKVELAFVGLSLHAAKTRIFTTATSPDTSFIDVDGNMIPVLSDDDAHLYAGRKERGDLQRRSVTELAHRISAAWSKFNKLRRVLENTHLCIKGKLKLFNAAETMRRMNARVSFALQQHPMLPWSSAHYANQHRFVMNLTVTNA
ncbi:pol [Symbiodinium sp. CCMP2592]|nr:pol [Symbiodinium sp. CCMP2592]